MSKTFWVIGGEEGRVQSTLMQRRGWGFKRLNGGFFDAVAVAFALPYRLSFQCSGSYPASDRCVVHSQPFRNLWRCQIFFFHSRENVLILLICVESSTQYTNSGREEKEGRFVENLSLSVGMLPLSYGF